jgi:hypothetical protein
MFKVSALKIKHQFVAGLAFSVTNESGVVGQR